MKTIFGADLVDMQFLCGIDIYSKHAWVIPLKEKKGVTIVNAFQKILDGSKRKANKTWADKGSEFYNRSIKLWFQKNDIECIQHIMKERFVVAERFIRTLKNKIYKHITVVS